MLVVACLSSKEAGSVQVRHYSPVCTWMVRVEAIAVDCKSTAPCGLPRFESLTIHQFLRRNVKDIRGVNPKDKAQPQKFLHESRSAARTFVSKTNYGGSSPSSHAKS